jgi:hypothetical protein
MGILTGILLAPVKGPYWIAKKVHDIAMDEFLDEGKVREQLRELYTSFEEGKISEEEFESQEEKLVERMEQIMSYKESKNA